jgi:ABC-type antimicrobial peptide transport system permease subunit
VLTYLATTIAANGKETPYSMVGAVDRAAAPFLPEDLGDEGIVLNSWEAEDLEAGVGDEVRVDYYRVETGNRLVEASAVFTVRGVVPLEGLAADRTWMPDFPGMADAEDSDDWSPGLPLDLTRIRDKDEDYWDTYKGTPKGFISAAAGRALWSNRWGEATALRVPTAVADRATIERVLLEKLQPREVGLVVRDFREAGMSAANSPVDIGQLFLSMSFFLIVAAVVLVAMLFRFNVELRNKESGLLAAVGVSPRKIMRWRMWEALVVVVAGSAVALPLAMAYSAGILRFIETIWNSEGDGRFFVFRVNPATVIVGLVVFILLMMLGVWLVARKQAKRGVSLRLEAGTEEMNTGSSAKSLIGSVVCLVLGFAAMGAGGVMGTQGAFFTAGFLLLLAGLFLYRWKLGKVTLKSLTASGLSQLNAARRPSRSLAVTGIMASGVFLVVAVAAFRKDTSDDWTKKDGGTGGYALWVETAGPINRVGDGAEAIDYFELGDDQEVVGAVLPFRKGAGDDASCFNLNTVTRPRLLATNTGELAERGSFGIKSVAEGLDASWSVLKDGEALRAFVDETTLMWVLKAKVGARLTYEDEFGNPFDVEIAGTLADSVFQGNFVVDEDRFLERFPSQGGYSLFLAEVTGDVEVAKAEVQKSLSDRGAEVASTTARLKAFHEVENTYIAIFHVLGGLGVILGAAGLGLVTARNLAERRYEFAVLKTVGIPGEVMRGMIFREVGQFLRWGLGIGMVAAVVAIIPNLSLVNPAVALGWVISLVVLVALNAWFWSWLGYRKNIEKVSGAQREMV